MRRSSRLAWIIATTSLVVAASLLVALAVLHLNHHPFSGVTNFAPCPGCPTNPGSVYNPNQEVPSGSAMSVSWNDMDGRMINFTIYTAAMLGAPLVSVYSGLGNSGSFSTVSTGGLYVFSVTPDQRPDTSANASFTGDYTTPFLSV
ncbi:MAG: hypothetical protein L3K15_03130 [Thermoplasmata archaeon]|nr:hypothetical protein [Thermoplasmata archaeon]